MSRKLFDTIIDRVCYHDPFFKCKSDAIGKIVFSSHQKCSAAIHMLSYGVVGDLVDEYVCMRESTCVDSIYKFCGAVLEVFDNVYLRELDMEDT
jgi:hypothetical protein